MGSPQRTSQTPPLQNPRWLLCEFINTVSDAFASPYCDVCRALRLIANLLLFFFLFKMKMLMQKWSFPLRYSRTISRCRLSARISSLDQLSPILWITSPPLIFSTASDFVLVAVVSRLKGSEVVCFTSRRRSEAQRVQYLTKTERCVCSFPFSDI